MQLADRLIATQLAYTTDCTNGNDGDTTNKSDNDFHDLLNKREAIKL